MGGLTVFQNSVQQLLTKARAPQRRGSGQR
jgi:hypothetical protein